MVLPMLARHCREGCGSRLRYIVGREGSARECAGACGSSGHVCHASALLCAHLRTEFVGICKYGLGLKPTTERHLRPALDVLKMIARLDCAEKYPHETGVMRPWADRVLSRP